MSISSETKKEIANDWLNKFPQLSIYTNSKLYKIIGPIAAGIEIVKLPRADEYRPYFVCYSLWDEKDCMDGPLLLQEISTPKGEQLNVPYSKHADHFESISEYAKNQILISFEENVHIKRLLEMISFGLGDPLMRISPPSQILLYTLKFHSVLYVNDPLLINQVLNEILLASKSWQPNLFEWKFGSFDNWLKEIKAKIDHRELFLKQIAINKQEKKLAKLKYSELVM